MSFVSLRKAGKPTLVALHGTGGNEVEMFQFGQRLLPTAGVLAIRGNEPEGRLNRFFRRLAEGVFDEPNLIYRANELADFVLAEIPEGPRLVTGFSNGANIAAAVLLLRPEVFQAAALFAPMVPLEPAELSDLGQTSVLMVTGQLDPIVPIENARRLESLFSERGAKVDHRFHNGGHEIDEASFSHAQNWLLERAMSSSEAQTA